MSSKALGNQKVSRSKSTPRRRNYFKRNKARVNNKFRPYIPKNRSGSIPNAVGATTSVIKGSEIIYTVGAVSGDIQSIIPVNPRSMNRCIRLYNTARTFQQWRPLNLEVEWCPTCPTTATGVVQIGTLWSSSVPSADVPSTLQVSNGGAIGAVYTRFRSRIQLNGRLSQNWYYFNDLSEDSNPFCIAFKVNLANSGYFILHYTYQFNNPTTQFQNSSSQPEGVGGQRRFHVFEPVERGERLAFGRVDAHVFAHAFQVDDVLEFDQRDHVVGLDREKFAAVLRQRDAFRRLFGMFAAAADEFGERFGPLCGTVELVETEGFEQVVDRFELESLDGVFGVGGREDDHRPLLRGERAHEIDAAEIGHVDVAEDQIHGLFFERAGGFERVAVFARKFQKGNACDVGAQLAQCERFVVDGDAFNHGR